MWTPGHRRAANRNGLRYPSDLTDDEWAMVEPLIPPARQGGRKRSVNVREVLNGIFYVLWTGCQWKALPKDLPPKSTVHDYLELWNWDGTVERIHHALYGTHPVKLSITHISYLGFAPVESSVILSVTPIRGGVTDDRRHDC